jgi:hypothetical protein
MNVHRRAGGGAAEPGEGRLPGLGRPGSPVVRSGLVALVAILVVAGCSGGSPTSPGSGQATPGTPGSAAAASGGPAGSTASSASAVPAASIDTGTVVGVTLASDKVVSATIDEEGGTLVATAGSITYTLAVPVDALLSPATITMTPIATISGSPLEVPPAAGVVFGPDGLLLAATATLTITGGPPAPGTIAFGFDGSGTDFHLVPYVPGSGIVIPVSHFSGVGYGAASPAIVARIASMHVANAIDAIGQALAADFVAHKDDLGSAPLADRFAEAQRLAETAITAAMDDPLVLGPPAITQMLGIERQYQLLGLAHQSDYSKLAPLLDKAEAALRQMCADGSADPVATIRAILGLERQRQLTGLESAGLADISARLDACKLTLSVKPEIAWHQADGNWYLHDVMQNHWMVLSGPATNLVLGISEITRTPLGAKPAGQRYRWMADVPLMASGARADDGCWTGAPFGPVPGYEPLLHVEIVPDLNVTRPVAAPKGDAGASPAIAAEMTMDLRGGIAEPINGTCMLHQDGATALLLLLAPSWATVKGSSPERVLFGGGAVTWTRQSPHYDYHTWDISTNVVYTISK